MRMLVALPFILIAGLVLGSGAILGVGFALDSPEMHLEQSDAIIVISGDEDLARFREGLRLYRQGWGRVLIFSGAARDQAISNGQVMRDLAVEVGVREQDVLVDHHGQDTLGNARNTRRIMEEHDLKSAIVVTSPYHLRRALVTFEAVYGESGIRLIAHSAPDSKWRKLTWWRDGYTRRLTLLELEKLAYILVTGRYN